MSAPQRPRVQTLQSEAASSDPTESTGSLAPSTAPTVNLDLYPNNPTETVVTVDLHLLKEHIKYKHVPKAAIPEYQDEAECLKSFENSQWPTNHKVQPQELATAGFFYMGPKDKVRCAFCSGKVKHWGNRTSAIEVHAAVFPDCPQTARSKQEMQALKMRKEEGQEYSSLDTVRRKRQEELRQETQRLFTQQRDRWRKSLQKMGYEMPLIEQAEQRVTQTLSMDSVLEKIQEITKARALGTPLEPVEPREPLLAAPMALAPQDMENKEEEEMTSVAARDRLEQLEKLKEEVASAREERDELSNKLKCRICRKNPTTALFLTCRHFCTCASCADKIKDCPVCHQTILGTVDVWMG